MGWFSKSSTTITKTTTVASTVVKLSYLQTLATSQNLINASDLETEAFDEDIKNAQQKDSLIKAHGIIGGLIGAGFGAIGAILGFFGFGHTKVSTNENLKSSGAKVKDTWNQPYFDKISYKLGIKEMAVSRYTFADTSEFTSVAYGSPKEIIKISLVVDEYIPAQFDSSQVWLKYYIKIEGENNWVRINPLNKPTIFDSEGLIVPRILNYNIPKPTSAQIEDKYQYTSDPVKQVRIRVVLSRPSGSGNEASITPLLKSYRIAMHPRE